MKFKNWFCSDSKLIYMYANKKIEKMNTLISTFHFWLHNNTARLSNILNVKGDSVVCPEWRQHWGTNHRCLCRVKNMLAMYLKYHKAGLTPTTSVTSTVISPVKMSIGRKSLTNLRSEMIFLQGKPVFYIFLPSTPPYWQIILRFCWQWTPTWLQKWK